MTSLKRQANGFTILELLTVLIIIGLFATLIASKYAGIQEKNRNTERQSDMKTFQRQLEIYTAGHDYYPSTANLGPSSSGNLAFIAANMKGFNKETLRDPKAAAKDYSVASVPTPNKYSYAPTTATGGPCNNLTPATDCSAYTLTTELEGGSPNIVLHNLN
jgi:prepilin-type N-terminal cleavage/methylation domain-containing protein